VRSGQLHRRLLEWYPPARCSPAGRNLELFGLFPVCPSCSNNAVRALRSHLPSSDTVSSRQIPNLHTVSGGVTIESCTSACKASGFSVAGLEFGQECWCGSSPPSTTLLSDSDCSTACAANTTEVCGGSSKLTVFEDPTGQICLNKTLSANFNLAAVFVVPPTGARFLYMSS
jgi:hypothetical protein